MSYVDTVLTGELDTLRAAQAGRNKTLFKVAARLFQFVEAGALDEDDITDQLATEAHALGLPRHEIKTTLKSARKRASGKPADIPASYGPQRAIQRPHVPEPPDECAAPSDAWQQAAGAFLDYAQACLWDDPQTLGLDYLAARGLGPVVVWSAGLGYNPTRLERSRAKWGLPPDEERGDRLILPGGGIVIPYCIDKRIYKIEIRSVLHGKYTVPGSANTLYRADRLTTRLPAILVEGVFNAIAIQQEAGDLVTPVAIGAATHARRLRWIARLAAAPLVLVATDAGPAGEDAASYWLDVLRHTGRRWRPYYDDPNAMLQAGMDVRAWVAAGLA